MTGRTSPDTTSRARGGSWKAAFLAAFEETGLVKEACLRVGIGRSTAYDARKNDEEFAAAWQELEDDLVEAMEHEAYRRAVEGVKEPMVSAGQLVAHRQVYSDGLLQFLLRARRPTTYRDNVKVEHTGNGGGPVALEISPPAGRAAQVAQLLQDQGAVPKD